MHTDQEHGQAQGPDPRCLGIAENTWVCITQEGHWHSPELLSEKHGNSLLLTGARGAPGEVGVILISSCVFGGKGGVENVAFWGALLTGRSATDINIDSIWGVDVFLVCPILSLLAVAGAITVDNSWGETEGTFRTSQHIDLEYRKDSRLSCDMTRHLRLPSLALSTSVCLMLR